MVPFHSLIILILPLFSHPALPSTTTTTTQRMELLNPMFMFWIPYLWHSLAFIFCSQVPQSCFCKGQVSRTPQNSSGEDYFDPHFPRKSSSFLYMLAFVNFPFLCNFSNGFYTLLSIIIRLYSVSGETNYLKRKDLCHLSNISLS